MTDEEIIEKKMSGEIYECSTCDADLNRAGHEKWCEFYEDRDDPETVEYIEKKRAAWKADYSEDIPWPEFLIEYFECGRCGIWQKDLCICYAR